MVPGLLAVVAASFWACSSGQERAGESVPLEGAGHVDFGQTVSYGTTPPTSGSHWGAPADCGVYDREVADEHVVHNMEHGHVIISYNLPDAADAERIEGLAEKLPDLGEWGIVRPYSKIDPGTVAMTAWRVIDTVKGVDKQRITSFYETYYRNRHSEETAAVGPIPCASAVQGG